MPSDMSKSLNFRKKSFRDLSIRSFYSTTGIRIFEEVISPVLNSSKSYDRLTGYFTVESLTSVASGLAEIYRNHGKMRLVIGIHDVPSELISARAIGELLPQELVEIYRNRLLEDVSLLAGTAEKSAIAAMAWMLRLGFVEIRVASPRTSNGIYHQKRMIFRDHENNVIAGTGSLNETIGGLSNIEEMQFSFSWRSDEDLTRDLVESFEDIWSGNQVDIDIIELSESFASQLLDRLDNPANPLDLVSVPTFKLDLSGILDLIEKSPTFVPFNLSTASLYPHQERVFVEALSRWPVRVMLADEVGLGKTLEAGILIAYMLRMKFADQITIVAPASLLRQWQEEMYRHFNLKFSIFNSGKKIFQDIEGNQDDWIPGRSNSRVPLKLISAQWARLNEDAFNDFLPSLLVVDEAHAARVSTSQYGATSTRFWKLLDRYRNEVPHVLLLTATPMQVHPSEYHGLLRILGLPKEWQKFSKYENSLNLVTSKSSSIALDDARDLSDLLLSSFDEYAWLPSVLTHADSILIMELRAAAAKSPVSAAIAVQQNFENYRSILIKVHPGHFLTCRNTKAGLERFGYKFPKRKFTSPAVKMEGNLEKYEWSIEQYLTSAYGKTEESLKPSGNFPIGFAKSGFYQRLVSSLYASKSSLLRRRDKLNSIKIAIGNSDFDLISSLISDFDIDDDDASVDFLNKLEINLSQDGKLSQVLSNVIQAVDSECMYINELLTILEKFGTDVEKYDPKFAMAMQLLTELSRKGSVLVFSRYTDTLEGFLKLFESSELPSAVSGYAQYTGERAWIKSDLGFAEATKSDVTDALNSNQIRIVFCSDAASEGLNLQEANALINLDVPWNPARLEQRIGRIARLGQKSPEVTIVNLWYPESIEAKMYSRLLNRRSEYQLAVGEFPEIFSNAIRDELRTRFNGDSVSAIDPYIELQRLREDFQRNALEKLWERAGAGSPLSNNLRRDLVEIVRNSSSKSVSSSELTDEPGQRNSVTLLSPVLRKAITSGIEQLRGVTQSVIGVFSGEVLVALAIENPDKKLRLVSVNSVGRLLKAIIGQEKIRDEDFYGTEFEPIHINSRIPQYLVEQPNIPNHASAKVPYEGIFTEWNQPQLTYTIEVLAAALVED